MALFAKSGRRSGYALVPQPDITAYELAHIVIFYDMSQRQSNELANKYLSEHPEIQRHLKYWERTP